jgi:uncharacterized membrane protein YbaN (DUF454 family)
MQAQKRGNREVGEICTPAITKMTTQTLFLLLTLNFAHFLGDFTPLNKWMLKAKRYGKPVSSVLAHGAVNSALYMLAALFFTDIRMALLVFAIETGTHTATEVLKGRINRWFPVVEDRTKAVHWAVTDADRLLHQVVF